jgi:hypothetical protein
MTTPRPVPLPELGMFGADLVDTPSGQRLAVTVTILMPAATAKDVAAVFARIAAAMSETGLIVANGTVTP